jgi:hypothetical protein
MHQNDRRILTGKLAHKDAAIGGTNSSLVGGQSRFRHDSLSFVGFLALMDASMGAGEHRGGIGFSTGMGLNRRDGSARRLCGQEDRGHHRSGDGDPTGNEATDADPMNEGVRRSCMNGCSDCWVAGGFHLTC